MVLTRVSSPIRFGCAHTVSTSRREPPQKMPFDLVFWSGGGDLNSRPLRSECESRKLPWTPPDICARQSGWTGRRRTPANHLGCVHSDSAWVARVLDRLALRLRPAEPTDLRLVTRRCRPRAAQAQPTCRSGTSKGETAALRSEPSGRKPGRRTAVWAWKRPASKCRKGPLTRILVGGGGRI